MYLHNLYCSPSIIRMSKSRRMRWAGHVARMGEKRNAYRILVGNPEGKRPLGRPRHRWVDNIKMDLRDIWIGLIWLRIGTNGGLLWTRRWTFGSHKMLGSSRVAAQFAASQERLSYMSEFVINSISGTRFISLRFFPLLQEIFLVKRQFGILIR
jgi:hypothetical protein